MVQYTQEFKTEVRRLYGKEFDKMLNENNAFLGRYLDYSAPSGFSNDQILKATSLDELKKQATIHLQKIAIYKSYWEQPGIKQS